MTGKVVVLVTCASRSEAERLARALVAGKLAPCVNVLPGRMRSVYRWKGKIESAREVLLLIKASRRNFPALERAIRRLHSYEVPEILALPVSKGSRPYLEWLEGPDGAPRTRQAPRKRG